VPGSILVLDAWPGNEYGHVAYVESVESDGKTFTISHANFAVGQPSGVREGVTIYQARAKIVKKGVALEGRAPLPFLGFLEKR
jgi:surface antigen